MHKQNNYDLYAIFIPTSIGEKGIIILFEPKKYVTPQAIYILNQTITTDLQMIA